MEKKQCQKCGFEWTPRVLNPLACPDCHCYHPEIAGKRTAAKIPGENTGEKNGMWKGDKVSYNALHDYVRYHFPRPKKCQNCGEKKRLDLANISQKYSRDLSDWEWICRKCHMHKDGRSIRLRFTRPHTKESREKISSSNKGKPKSEEWKAKMRGRKHTPETILKFKKSALERWKLKKKPSEVFEKPSPVISNALQEPEADEKNFTL